MKNTVSTSTDPSTFNLDFLLEELLSTLVAILWSRHGKWAELNNNGYTVTIEWLCLLYQKEEQLKFKTEEETVIWHTIVSNQDGGNCSSTIKMVTLSIPKERSLMSVVLLMQRTGKSLLGTDTTASTSSGILFMLMKPNQNQRRVKWVLDGALLLKDHSTLYHKWSLIDTSKSWITMLSSRLQMAKNLSNSTLIKNQKP